MKTANKKTFPYFYQHEAQTMYLALQTVIEYFEDEDGGNPEHTEQVVRVALKKIKSAAP